MFTVKESPLLTKQFRKPRSRKKRIVEKWKKNPQNHCPSDVVYIYAGDVIFCHPQVADRIRQAVNTL